jgi:hypothetical protein
MTGDIAENPEDGEAGLSCLQARIAQSLLSY